jgi:hypothetical protein
MKDDQFKDCKERLKKLWQQLNLEDWLSTNLPLPKDDLSYNPLAKEESTR